MDTENGGGFKVADRRMFNADGDLRDHESETFSTEPGNDSEVSSPFLAEEAAGDEEMSFETLIFSLSTSALLQLGMAPNPETGKLDADLPAAKQTIDILEILREKTKGNLSQDESGLLEECIHDLKLSYVRIIQSGKLGLTPS